MPRTLEHKMQNFWPESPLEDQICFWAAPSASMMAQWKCSLMSPVACWSKIPALGSAMGLQKMDSSTLVIIWATLRPEWPRTWTFPGQWCTKGLHGVSALGIRRRCRKPPRASVRHDRERCQVLSHRRKGSISKAC